MTKKETEKALYLLEAEFDEFRRIENGVTIGHLCLVDLILDKLGDVICKVDYQHHHCKEKPTTKEYTHRVNSERALGQIKESLENVLQSIDSVR